MGCRNRKTLIYTVLGISMLLNIYFINDKVFRDKNYDDPSDWIDYAVTLRLDKQGDIFHNYAGYLKQIRQEEYYFDEFVGYCKAAGRLCQPELMAGAFYMESEKAENSEDIQYLFHRISVCGILHSDEQQLRKMSDTQLLQLQTCYEELEELMNRNRENQSLAYYVLMDEYDSKESKEVQMQTLAVIDEIDSVLDSFW